MSDLRREIRYAVRRLRKSPGFTSVALLTIALAIGSSTAIFSLTSAALMKSLPFRDPDRLVQVRDVSANGNHEASYPDYEDWRTKNHVFSRMGGYGGGYKGVLRLKDDSVQVRIGAATATFFSTLGVSPVLGRDFLPAEELQSSESVVLVDHRFWREHFGSDPAVVGRSIMLNGHSRRIIGVLPDRFNFAPAQGAEIWVPMRMGDEQRTRRNLWWLDVVARLKPSVSLRSAQSDLSLLASQLEKAYPDSNSGLGVQLLPLRDQIVGPIRPIIFALLGAVLAVMLIACANIAGLLLGRASARAKEIAIRTALGASRSELVRQFLVESLVLAVIGGAIGIAWAGSGVKLLLAAVPEEQAAALPYLHYSGLNLNVLLLSLLLSLVTGLLFGLVPAFHGSNPAAAETLKSSDAAATGRDSHRTRGALVIAEIAVAIILMAGAGLMLKSTLRLLHVDPGFQTENLLTLQVASASGRYDDPARLTAFHDELLARVRAVPGVKAAGTVDVLPLSGGQNTALFVVEGQPVPVPGHENEANVRSISPGYFHDMGIPLMGGRPFDGRDRLGAPRTLIVNRTLARRFFGSSNPVGKRLKFTFNDKQTFREIVGVVGDENQIGLDEAARPVIYENYFQSPDDSMSVVVRTAGKPEAYAAPVRKAIAALDPDLLIYDVTSMGSLISQAPSTFLRRFPAFLIGVFAAAALLLAAIGLYGIMAFSVARRTREIGVRMAIGARRSDVVRMVLGDGGRLIVAGVLAGVAGALGLTRLLSTLLFGVSPTDPATLTVVTLVLTLVALSACYLPARRATKIDPMVALRSE